MPPPPRAKIAIDAMKELGFGSKEAAHVLKKLLELYDNNYEYIEENGYQVLIDKILEEQELKAAGVQEKENSTGANNEPSKKRLRNVREKNPSSSDSPGEAFLKKPKLEPGVSPELDPRVSRSDLVSPQLNNKGKMVDPVSSPAAVGGNTAGTVEENIAGGGTPTSQKVKTTGAISQQSPSCERLEHASPHVSQRETRASARARKMSAAQAIPNSSSFLTSNREYLPDGENSGKMICYKEPKIEPGIEIMPPSSKDGETDDDSLVAPSPIAIICPPHSLSSAGNEAHKYQRKRNDSPTRDLSIMQPNNAEPSTTKNADKGKGKVSMSNIALENGKKSELVASQEVSTFDIDIASSDSGDVKLKFCFNSNRTDLHIPSLDAIVKMMEEKCLKSYKVLQPDFSLMKIMKDMCQCAMELSSEATDGKQENTMHLTPSDDLLKNSGMQSLFDGRNACPTNCSANGGYKVSEKIANNDVARVRGDSTSNSLAVIPQPEIALGDLRPIHDPNDITKGEERVRISLVNEISNEKFPSSFNYIPQNIAYQGAYVNFTLARIGDEDCCSDCFGDCVAATIPCPCARETGGEFAYTLDGLVKETFLDECISMKRDPEKQHRCYCKECPIERSKKKGLPDSCEGHLVRKFIKECWSKCGCNKQCGNRIVQRGITCNLQVFYTPEGKGWGLRALDELPRGSFVCEFVGEVLTNMEVYNRTIQSSDYASYPVLLDAGWGSDGVLKDEEALFLDATFYGNVARFVNHRCFDANLVEIPVEVESPDHHYYHIAFFTTRKIEPYEELTWDYGIDFDDPGHPVKAFKCRCGSKFCRDKRRSRTRSKALVLS